MSGDYETLEINQPNWKYEKKYIQICLMSEKELKELEKFVK